jgi:chondroitin sulfate synthase
VPFYAIVCVVVGVYIGFSLAISFLSVIRKCMSPIEGLNNKMSNKTTSGNYTSNLFTTVEPGKDLVIIGVMTAKKYLDTRAKAIYDTWAPHIPGKLFFFTSENSESVYPIPFVSLPGVDDSYPPQKKSFLMFKFMHDNYLDKFEWFMRVDDDVYLKPDRIEQFLRSINSSQRQFIGQPGTGNKEEFGLLSLEADENFCMGGPGIMMTKATLKLFTPHIKYCLKNLYSTHEDVEVGRCVRRFAGIPCTWSYEVMFWT